MKRVAVLLLLLGGCAAKPHHPVSAGAAAGATVTSEQVDTWETLIAPEDRARIETLPERWTSANAMVTRRTKPLVTAEGALLEAGGALDQPAPPPGPYRCRRLRLGTGPRGFVAQTPGFCFVGSEAKGLSFTMQTGTERPDGWLYAAGDTRYVFLGGIAHAREVKAPGYGTLPGRGVAGTFERIGAFRWRLVMPRVEGGIDVYELIPVPPKMKGDPGAVQAPGGY